RVHAAVGRVDAAGGVLGRDDLRTGGLLVAFDAAVAGEEVGDLAADQVAAVELGGHLHGQAQPAPGLFHPFGVGDGAHEVAAEAEEGLDLAPEDALAGLHRVQALLARRLEAVLLLQPVQRRQFRLLGDAHRALALDVGVSAHRAGAGPRLADVA